MTATGLPDLKFTVPILPELWEPILVNAGNWVLVLRGFEREDGAATVQE